MNSAKNQRIKELATRLRLYSLPRILESECQRAVEQGKSNMEFLLELLEKEVQERDSRDLQRRLKAGRLPSRHDLTLFHRNYLQAYCEAVARKFGHTYFWDELRHLNLSWRNPSYIKPLPELLEDMKVLVKQKTG